MEDMKSEKCDDEVIYPCLRKCCWRSEKMPGDYIVLLSNRNEGVVVWSANASFPVGAYRDGFSPDCYEHYHGQITLG